MLTKFTQPGIGVSCKILLLYVFRSLVSVTRVTCKVAMYKDGINVLDNLTSDKYI